MWSARRSACDRFGAPAEDHRIGRIEHRLCPSRSVGPDPTTEGKKVNPRSLVRSQHGPCLPGKREEAKKAGVRFEAVQVTSDFPDEAILSIAKKKKCDVIVMASSGQGGVRGMLIGSDTQKVLNQSKTPVLVLR